MKTPIKPILAIAALTVMSGGALAQIDNRPFQFKNSSGGLGMSSGSREAIIQDKVFDYRPDNMIRNNGQLLAVDEGPGNMALVRHPGTNDILPTYKGSSFRMNPAMSAGVFNAYFTPSSGGSSYRTDSARRSWNTVNTWTGRVVPDDGANGAGYSGQQYDSIDVWTGQVLVLSAY